MPLLSVFFLIFKNPSFGIENQSFNFTDDTIISKVDTIVDSNLITETIQLTVQKWQTALLFPPTHIPHDVKGSFVSYKFINDAFFPEKIACFISVVHHQSNYLS